MRRGQFTIRVFVASPEDVAEERAIAKDIVDELNQAWHSQQVRFEYISGEDATPGFADSPQVVVNRFVGDKYDIFVGILWTRFGTPTPNAGSGTEEEFDRAYARFKADPNSLDILIFFSDVSVPPSEVDPTQLSKVMRFREKVSAQGGLYAPYSTRQAFATHLRVYLTRILAKQLFGFEPPEPTGLPTEPPPTEPPTDEGAANEIPDVDDDEDKGFFELVDDAETELTASTHSMQHMTALLQKLSASLTERGTLFRSRSPNPHEARNYFDAVAVDLHAFATKLPLLSLEFSSHFLQGTRRVSRAASMVAALPHKPKLLSTLSPVRDAVDDVVQILESTRESIRHLQALIQSLPPATTKFARSKREASLAVDRLLTDWDSATALLKQLQGLLVAITAPYSTRKRP